MYQPAAAAAASLAAVSHASPSRLLHRCQAPAQLQCPKCLSLNLPKAPYCSQECFKVGGAAGQGGVLLVRAAFTASQQRMLQPPAASCSPPLSLHLCASGCCRASDVQLAWPEHKSVHKAASAAAAWLYCTKRGRGRTAALPGFDWTGPLRPAPIGPPRQVRSSPQAPAGGS